MATQEQTLYSRWKLSDKERRSGATLSPLQVMHIQNQMADLAEQICALHYDPSKPLEFVQQDAHLKGQLVILRFLLLNSEEVISQSQENLN